jgi:hypothetical protein
MDSFRLRNYDMQAVLEMAADKYTPSNVGLALSCARVRQSFTTIGRAS